MQRVPEQLGHGHVGGERAEGANAARRESMGSRLRGRGRGPGARKGDLAGQLRHFLGTETASRARAIGIVVGEETDLGYQRLALYTSVDKRLPQLQAALANRRFGREVVRRKEDQIHLGKS